MSRKTCPGCMKRYSESILWKNIPIKDELCADCWLIELLGRLPLLDGVQIIGAYYD